MCFVFIWEQTANCATYSINWLVFITEMKRVYYAVRIGPLNKAVCASYSKGYLCNYTSNALYTSNVQVIYRPSRCSRISWLVSALSLLSTGPRTLWGEHCKHCCLYRDKHRLYVVFLIRYTFQHSHIKIFVTAKKSQNSRLTYTAWFKKMGSHRNSLCLEE